MPLSAHATPRARPRWRRGGLAAAVPLLLAVACSSEPEPVPYVAPAPGTVFDYGAFTNTVTTVDGWRTSYTDQRGRAGRRVGLFITEDPARPLSLDPAALDSLWPLRLGRHATFQTATSEERDRWEFRVLDTTTVTVPAGTYWAYVVEGVQTPELVRSPQAASSVIHTWWYAPEVAAVVRFQSVYVMGPAAGRRFDGQLHEIRSAPGADSAGASGAAASTGT